MKESSFWGYLKRYLPADGHYTRIENSISSGFPDVHYTLEGFSGTIELKSTKRPGAKYPFNGTDGLRKSQIAWIEEETSPEVDGFVILALRCGPGVFLLDAKGCAVRLHKMTLEDIESHAGASWRVGRGGISIAGIPYDDILDLLGGIT